MNFQNTVQIVCLQYTISDFWVVTNPWNSLEDFYTSTVCMGYVMYYN